ncbi:MAG: hypothetical protein AB1750_08400 [Chloroflexota bacterium]
MKKTLLIVAIAVLAIAALSAGVAFAQGGNPPYGGYGMMGGGYGMMGGGRGGYGPIHDYVEEALADKLGITEEQVEDELAAGKTMWQIALDHGVAEADLQAFLLDVHKTAFAAAVADGVMTQEQADYMLQHMEQYGFGNCPMTGGGYGNGYGRGPGMMGGGRGRGQ